MSYNGYSAWFHSALAEQIRPVGYCSITLTSGNTTYPIATETIKSVVMKTTGDPLSRRLPTETIQIDLLDYDNYWNPDNPNNLLQNFVYPTRCVVKFGLDNDGVIDWGQEYTYYIQQAPTWSNHVATFKGVKKLALWTMIFERFPGSCPSLDYLYQKVLATAGVSYAGGGPLDAYSVNIGQCLPKMSVKDALLQIAVAGGGVAMSSDNDNPGDAGVYIFDWTDVNNPLIIMQGDMLEQPTSEFLPEIKNEVLHCYDNDVRSVSNPAETVLDYSETFGSTASVTMHFDFSKLIMTYGATITTSNMTKVSEQLYRNGYDITFRPTSTANPVTIVISAKPVTVVESDYTQVINQNGIEDEILDCNLLNRTNAHRIALYRGQYLSATRRSYKFKYRGDPSIDVCDVLRVDLPFIGIVPCVVLSSEFSYDGSFHGEMTVRINGEAEYDISSAICGIAVAGDAVCGDDEV